MIQTAKCLAANLLQTLLQPQSLLRLESRNRSYWRYSDVGFAAAWPNKKEHLTHRKHYHEPHTYGVQKTTRMRIVDNSKIGMKAMAEGKPAKVFHVYSRKHQKKPHGAYGKLGDRVYCSVKGEKIHGIIVGLKQNQIPGIPRFDSNNVVLIEPNGNPLGTRIHAPIPNCIRPKLKLNSNPKVADYTKLLSIATRFV